MVVRLGHAVLRLVMRVRLSLLLDLVFELLGLELAAARDAQLSSLARQTLLSAGAGDAVIVV